MSPRPRRKIESLDPYADEIRKLTAEGLADARIADGLPIDCDGQMIDRWRKRRGGATKTKFVSKLDPFADDIRRMYVDEKLTDEVIAERPPIEITGDSITTYRVRKLGIPTDRKKKSRSICHGRPFRESERSTPGRVGGKRWHTTQKRYVRSAKRVGEKFGVSASTARDWLSRLDLVETRIDGKRGWRQCVSTLPKKVGVCRALQLNWVQPRIR